MDDRDLLWTALRRTASVVSLDVGQWDLLIRQARRTKLLPRLAFLLEAEGLLGELPEKVRQLLGSGRVIADKHERIMRWEVRQVRRALGPMGVPVVLLKGAAYVMGGLPPARGRLYADIDIMVPKADLSRVEKALLAAGWQTDKVNPYDDRYYRQWMHELPPLRHATRKTVLDVHHSILPETGRLHPSPDKLFEAARPLPGGFFHVFAPADVVLHSAVHLFQDGDLAGGARDLIDLDDLLRHFGREPEFWEGLVPRARELGLGRPLYYVLRYARRFLHTPVPETVLDAARLEGPGPLTGRVMDALVTRALEPEHPDHPRRSADTARWMLYVRSHWLRMPPLLLASHLAKKALRRWYEEEEEEA